nr:glycine betaine ABC transporter substrate-binding protein [Gordonia sp. SID5947]
MTVLALAAVAGCSESAPSAGQLVMGAPASPSMQVMAQIYAGALRHAGSAVSMTVPRGTYRSLLDDMDATTVDLFPAFSGRLLAELAPQSAPPTADAVYTELNRSLPQGVSVGDATTVSATPQVFVAASVADRGGVTALADCARLSPGLPLVVVGAPDGPTVDALSAAGCRFGPVESVPSTSAVVRRVAGGGAVGLLTPLDVAGDDAEGVSGDIRALTAPKSAKDDGASGTAETSPSRSTHEAAPNGDEELATGPRAEQLVPVYRTAALSRDQVKTVNKVAGEMTTADLATLARKAAAGEPAAVLANGWLAEHGL